MFATAKGGSPPAEPTEAVEVVGYLYTVCGDLLLDHQKPNLPHEPLMTVAQHKRIMAAKDGELVEFGGDWDEIEEAQNIATTALNKEQ